MSSPKTTPTSSSVTNFLNSVENDRRRKDGFELLKIMKEITQEKPVLWGSSIVGFGLYHYKYKSGREGDIFQVGFSPRKKSEVYKNRSNRILTVMFQLCNKFEVFLPYFSKF